MRSRWASAAGETRAIDEAIERWMDRRIDAAIESELGIPEGLPYLTGFVFMHEALIEGAA